MKATAFILTAILGAAPAFAQAPKPATKPGATQPGAAQQPSATQQPASGKPQAQAKTPEEFAAYQAAAKLPDPAAAEAAANDFATKFPESALRVVLYQNVMNLYQANNNADKVIEYGRKVLQMEPENAVAAVMTATVLAERTRDTDLDKDERLAEARRDADLAIQNVDNISIPAGVPAERVQAAKNTIVSMAYAAMGAADIVTDNYAAAEKNLQKSVDVPGLAPDALTLLRLAIAQDHVQKYAEGLANVSKAATATEDPTVLALIKQEQERLTKLAAPKPAPAAQPPKP